MRRILVLTLALATMALTAPPIDHETAAVNGVKLHYAKSDSGCFKENTNMAVSEA